MIIVTGTWSFTKIPTSAISLTLTLSQWRVSQSHRESDISAWVSPRATKKVLAQPDGHTEPWESDSLNGGWPRAMEKWWLNQRVTSHGRGIAQPEGYPEPWKSDNFTGLSPWATEKSWLNRRVSHSHRKWQLSQPYCERDCFPHSQF